MTSTASWFRSTGTTWSASAWVSHEADSLSLKVSVVPPRGADWRREPHVPRCARPSPLRGAPLAISSGLAKAVPHGAGLGGGSADAAAALRAGAGRCGSRRRVDPARSWLSALELGSDVPALLGSMAQRVRGRGDRLEAVAVTGHSISPSSRPCPARPPTRTPPCFQPRSATTVGGTARRPRAHRRQGPLGRHRRTLGEQPRGRCRVARIQCSHRALRRARRRSARGRLASTGSGGAVFCVAREGRDAEGRAAAMRAAGFVARACRTIG